jgi:hypothetical protein
VPPSRAESPGLPGNGSATVTVTRDAGGRAAAAQRPSPAAGLQRPDRAQPSVRQCYRRQLKLKSKLFKFKL